MIITLSFTSLGVSYFLFTKIISTTLDRVIQPEVSSILLDYQRDLKIIDQLNKQIKEVKRDLSVELQYSHIHEKLNHILKLAQEEEKLRAQVKKVTMVINESKSIKNPDEFKRSLIIFFKEYYLTLFILALIFALAVSSFFCFKIMRLYQNLANSDIKKAKKLQELDYFKDWKLMASKLAHEINNPLTPIEMMVSHLPRIYENTQANIFKESLYDTEIVVREEVHKLKEMVEHFSRFSKLPEPEFVHCDLVDYCEVFIRQNQSAWPEIILSIKSNKLISKTSVLIDKRLFKQCLINLIKNALQANQGKADLEMSFSFNIEKKSEVALTLSNTGVVIPNSKRLEIFKLHYSHRENAENMGLGLPIIKKIILDHKGDISCLSMQSGAAFKINLPLNHDKKNNK
jgi:signal transduction histidine kinase